LPAAITATLIFFLLSDIFLIPVFVKNINCEYIILVEIIIKMDKNRIGDDYLTDSGGYHA
jgi:hypothetical protein